MTPVAGLIVSGICLLLMAFFTGMSVRAGEWAWTCVNVFILGINLIAFVSIITRLLA